MSTKKTAAALIVAVTALTMTACSGSGEPSTATPSNSGGDILDNNGASVSEPYSDVTANEDEPAVSEPSEEETIWDVIPEIPVTDESAFGYKYDSELGGMVVTDYLKESPKVRIPDTIEGKPVVKVDFLEVKKELTELVMPNTVKDYSLSDMIKESIEFINIPDSVTEIGDFAFSDCTSLTSINIPDGVTSIDSFAFASCISLTSITIPGSVTSIGNSAFGDCSSLTSINIPDSVTSIDSLAFAHCTSLTGINIPDSVAEICSDAFYGCTSLANIDVAEENSEYFSVDGVLFSKELSRLDIYPEGRTESTYSIPDGVTSIGNDAFFNGISLTNITIPDGVTSIGDSAFSDCSSLTSINIPDGVTEIGDYAFEYCQSLTSITIPDGVTEIGIQAFYYCTSLTSINIPDSVTSIDYTAFSDCESLTSATYKGETYSRDNINELYDAINGY